MDLLNSTNRQYETLIKRLGAHVNNLPLAIKLSGFLPEFTKTVNDLLTLLLQEPDLYQQFIQIDLPQRVHPLLKNIAVYLFLKQKFQMNCVRFNNKAIFLNLNKIYLNCDAEDGYYKDRFQSNIPNAVDFMFSAIQEFLKIYTRTGFLDVGKIQNAYITLGDRRYEILYRTNFFVEGNKIFLYQSDEQALLEAAQRLDFNGLMDNVFQHPILSGKNFYDLFLFAHVAQQFLLNVLQDRQTTTPLLQDALSGNQMNASKALRFLASVVSNEIPTLYNQRELLNKPDAPAWKNYQKDIVMNMRQKLSAFVTFDQLRSVESKPLFSPDNWDDSWGGLTLMDLLSLPASIVGAALNPEAQLLLNCGKNDDYVISTFLIYRPIVTMTAPQNRQYEPRLLLTIQSARQRLTLPIPAAIEAALPPHLFDFLTKDLRGSLKEWVNQLTNWDNSVTSQDAPLSAFLNQINIAQFLENILGDRDLSRNYSRRMGYYFWRILRRMPAMQNGYIKNPVQDFLRKQMYLVDTDMLPK